MHYVEQSATTGLRERRMQETSARLSSVSRRLTAEHGLSGFTIEQACDEVGVSRRTFFNYFASKEDAVIGVDSNEEAERFATEFLARGDRGWSAVIDDLVELLAAHFEASDIILSDHGDFLRSLEREPKLLARFVGTSRDRERDAQRLVATRQGVAENDLRAQAVITVFSTMLRSAGERLIGPSNTRTFPELLTDSLAAAREVLAVTNPRKATS